MTVLGFKLNLRVVRKLVFLVVFGLVLDTSCVISSLPRKDSTIRLTTDAPLYFFPSWSPDGSKICFSTDQEVGDWIIGCVQQDGSEVWNLTSAPGWDFCPSWNPVADKIAFLTNRSNSVWLEIWIMDADGSNQRQLIPFPVSGINQMGDPWPPLPWSAPSWSPDGTKVAFGGWLSGSDGYRIWIADAYGTGLEQLTDMCGVWAAWNPDGDRIAFQSDRSNNWDVWVVNTDGSDLRQLTEDADEDIQPSWSPKGDIIAFISNRTGESQVWVMNADGSNQRQLTDMPSLTTTYYPAWSPDGKKIAFASTISGKWDIWIMTLSYPPGEICSVDIPNQMIKGWNYSASVSIANSDDAGHNFTLKLSGSAFACSPPERNVYFSTKDNQTLRFDVTALEGGTKTLTATLLEDSNELESRSQVVNVTLPATLRCMPPPPIEITGNPGQRSIDRKITIKNENSITALDVELKDSGEIAGWMDISPNSIDSIAKDQSYVIELVVDIPEGTSQGNHNGLLIINGKNLGTMEIPVILTVIHEGLDWTTIIVAIIGAAAIIVAAIITARYKMRRK